MLGVGDDAGDVPERRLALDVAVGAHQHGDGTDAVERRDHDEGARPGRHQHADVVALAHADRQQAGDDVVDALLARRMGVRAVLEEEEDAVGAAARLLVEQQRQGDLRVALDLAEPGEAGEGGGGLAGQLAHAAHRRAGRLRRGADEAHAGADRAARGRARRHPPFDARGGASVSATRTAASGRSASPSRQCAHSATTGHVARLAVEPTTRPKCPARSVAS